MKHIVTASLCSAFLASALTVGWMRLQPNVVTAQDRGRNASERIQAKDELVLADERFRLSGALTPDERVNVQVYEDCNLSVVNITTSLAARDSLFFFEPPAKGAGSGWVFDRQGRILTNYHVIAGATDITVTFHDGSQFDAGVIGFDAVNDIAVLKVEAPRELLRPLQLGRSAGLRVGQKVFAIGNPFGWERTMSQGIISSLNRTLRSKRNRSMKSIIQIDGSLNKGNSGGPLLDTRGRLIGMNVAIASQSGDSAGIGFAIPADTLSRIIPELLEHGRVTRPSIGISALARRNGRLTIALLTPEGPAERAGLRGYRIVRRTIRRGPFLMEEKSWDRDHADEILAVDGAKVSTVDEFLTAIDKRKPGEKTVLTIIREGQEMRVPVTLGVERDTVE